VEREEYEPAKQPATANGKKGFTMKKIVTALTLGGLLLVTTSHPGNPRFA